MHIGIDCRLPFYQRGGISQYTLQLIPALAAADATNDYTLFHLWKDKACYLPEAAANFERRNLHVPCHHRWEKWALSLELLAKSRPLDVFHSPDFIPPLRGAKRHVITVHDLNFLHYPHFLTTESRHYYRDQIAWAVETADHISADSEHTRRDLIELLNVPPEKVTTVHLAVNSVYEQTFSEAEISATLAKHNLPRGFILAVGTLEPRKNYPTLLSAYKQAREEAALDLDVPLVLVGRRGWLFDEIFIERDRLGLRRHVHHLEGIFDAELAHLYRAAGVVVTPSHYEGFGLPALEAMTCGCPVLVSDRGSLPEIVGEAGLILPADDAAAWAEALGRVLHDTALRDRMIALGHQQAKKVFLAKSGQPNAANLCGDRGWGTGK